MNLTQFKDPVSHMSLAGAVVALMFLMQKMSGSSFFTIMTVDSVKTFRENSIAMIHQKSQQ